MPDPALSACAGGSARNLAVGPMPPRSPRQQAMAEFLDASGWGGIVPLPLAGDASFRSYFRLHRGRESAVVMDAPPPQEDVGPYVAVSAILRGLGLSAPQVMAEDRTQGFLLIEDFGDDTYTRLLSAGADESALYTLAVDTLVTVHKQVTAIGAPDLPPYDDRRLLDEAVLLVDWYVPTVLAKAPSAALREEYLSAWRAVLSAAHEMLQPTLVLRDFHIDNLMLLRERPGVRACGLLDFQDAVIGSPAYDLVSLLEDARRDVPEALRQEMTARYLCAFPQFDRENFRRVAAILAVQRNCKILGIFTRLWQRDDKPGYLAHIPRLWRLIEGDLRHPGLSPIARWLDRHLPPPARRAPDRQEMLR
jgi:N-acetylmuramate 1-kinase